MFVIPDSWLFTHVAHPLFQLVNPGEVVRIGSPERGMLRGDVVGQFNTNCTGYQGI